MDETRARDGRDPALEQPSMRADLIGCLGTIVDQEQVRRAWVDHEPSSGLLMGGWLPAHVLNQIDDDAHLDDPASMLGITLRSEKEVALAAALGAAVELVPCSGPDPDTVRSPEWAAMLPFAEELLVELLRNDRGVEVAP